MTSKSTYYIKSDCHILLKKTIFRLKQFLALFKSTAGDAYARRMDSPQSKALNQRESNTRGKIFVVFRPFSQMKHTEVKRAKKAGRKQQSTQVK